MPSTRKRGYLETPMADCAELSATWIYSMIVLTGRKPAPIQKEICVIAHNPFSDVSKFPQRFRAAQRHEEVVINIGKNTYPPTGHARPNPSCAIVVHPGCQMADFTAHCIKQKRQTRSDKRTKNGRKHQERQECRQKLSNGRLELKQDEL